MSINLVDLLGGAVSGDVLSSVAKAAGTGESSVGAAAKALFPTLLAGMAQRAGSTEGAAQLFSQITGNQVNADIGSTIVGMLGGGQGSTLVNAGSAIMNAIFGGDRSNALVNALGQSVGMGQPTSRNVLMMLAPLALGLLKKYIVGQRLDAAGTAQLLRSQGSHLEGKLDGGLMAALGLGAPAAWLSSLPAAAAAKVGAAAAATSTVARETVTAAARTAAPVAAAAAAAPAAAAGGLGRWLPWIIAAAVGLFLLSQLGKCSKEAAPTPAPAPVATAPAPAPAPAAASEPASAAVAVAPVVEGMPAKVYFETGKSEFGEKGKEAVAFAAKWAKADAARKLAITGYTDRTGDVAANELLAKNRATGVRTALEAAGVPADAIVMEKPVFVEVGSAAGADAEARRVEINPR